MVFASSYNAPVVFFCQNNHWAISVPTNVQTRVPLSNRAKGYGFPGIRVDGNDVIAVHAVTEWALEHARQGKGPVLIEAFTYRVGAHTTADDPTKYRGSAEEDAWRAKDPLTRLEKYLRAEGLADDAFFAKVKADGDELAAYVRRTTHDLENPGHPDRLRQHLRRSAPPGGRGTGMVRGVQRRIRRRRRTVRPARCSSKGRPLMTTMTIAKAINEGLRATLAATTPSRC